MNLADVFRRHGPAYVEKYGAAMLPSHRAAIDAILSCHTPARGGSLYGCDGCGERHFAYHRCGNRACGQCGGAETEAWVERQRQRLLPVPYFLVTFTVPAELREVFRAHQRICYDLLLRASAEALQDVAQQPRRLEGRLGLLGVLHTWTRDLAYHPHAHYLVPGVVEGADGLPRFPAKPEYLLPARVLSARFRSLMQSEMSIEHPALFAQIAKGAWRRDFVVDMQAVGSGGAALDYLSRYIYKTAISGARLLWQSDTQVAFSYRESGTGEERQMILGAEEFLRRFLQHVLPKGFRRVRTSGFLSPAARERFERLAAFLGVLLAPRPAAKPAVRLDCPHCQKPMRLLAHLRRASLILCRPP